MSRQFDSDIARFKELKGIHWTLKTRVLLGVTGGNRAYKSPDLVRRLIERGADVQVVMTGAAQRFVSPMSFSSRVGPPDRSDLWDDAAEAAMGHIELARWAQVVLIAAGERGLHCTVGRRASRRFIGPPCASPPKRRSCSRRR